MTNTDATNTTPAPALDAVEEFAERIVADAAATTTTALATIGDRLGLWRALADGEPATAAGLAARTGTVERYTQEWCAAMAAAGYLRYEPDTRRFALPLEHAAVLADERQPTFLGGLQQLTRGMLGALEGVEAAFRDGGGVPIRDYDNNFWSGLERVNGIAFDHLLAQEWIPAVPGLERKLREGAVVADVGCGTGRALIRLAQAFPNSRFHGFDLHGPAVERATAAAHEAGVADRVSFRRLDATDGLPARYDAITTFDVLHDSRDPRRLVEAIRRALAPDGVYLILEIHCHERLEGETGPIGALLYGYSLLHCMTTSLAVGGAGLGTCGLPEQRLRQVCLEAGFASLRHLAESPFDRLYEVRP
jgi:SAM-dependent methyltransferase